MFYSQTVVIIIKWTKGNARGNYTAHASQFTA